MTRSLTEELADWVVGLDRKAVVEAAGDPARRCLLDTLGCGIAGSGTTEGRAAQAAVQDVDAGDNCAIWGTPQRASAPGAALVNGTAAHALELDDVNYTIGHPGAPVIPAALAVGEWVAAAGRDILVAIIAGYEVESRIAGGLGFAAHSRRGWHPTGTCGGFGAAASAGILLGLTVDQLVSALGLAGTTAGGVHAYKVDGAMSKRFHAGHAARDGVMAAVLARRGLTGPAWILDAEWGGLLAMMSDGAEPRRVVQDLGHDLAIGQVDFKLYPSCYSAHTAIEAALILGARHAIHPDEVATVVVRVNPLSARFCRATASRSALAAQMSIPYGVAAALTRGRLTAAEFGEVMLQDPHVRDLEARVTLAVDETLPDEREQATVEIVLRSGDRVRETVEAPRGSVARPPSTADLIEKFRGLAGLVLSREGFGALEAAVMEDRFLDDATPLWRALRGEASP